MVFSSNAFLFLFLPLFLAVYYLTPNRFRLRNWVVLLGSYAFYAWWRVDFLFLFIGVTIWNYLIGLAIARNGVRAPRSGRWLTLGVTVDLLLLGYFKYANFGVGSLDALLSGFGFTPFQLTHVILPIGISFYVFESISYIMDVYRGDTEATRHPVDFATFVALFPHLIAGPVFRYKDLAGQFESRAHTLDKFGEGSVRFMQGFVKKVFIADSIAPLANHAFALADPITGDAWLGAIAYTFQLYFDFSGYSDMAIGLGLMMGFRFMENFNQPYISQSITEFWRRWHISLSSWLRDYLYVPLGGNRGGTFNTYRNLFLTMLLGGLWHGANWTFLIWGAWHGVALCVNHGWRVLRGQRESTLAGRFAAGALTFLVVVIGWVFFKAASVEAALRVLGGMTHFTAFTPAEVSAAARSLVWIVALLAIVWLAPNSQQLLARHEPALHEVTAGRWSWQPNGRWALAVAVIFVVAVLHLSQITEFIYFQF